MDFISLIKQNFLNLIWLLEATLLNLLLYKQKLNFFYRFIIDYTYDYISIVQMTGFINIK